MKAQIKSWVVTLRATVVKEIVTSECTLEEATNEPFKFVVQERELAQPDFDVESVEPND